VDLQLKNKIALVTGSTAGIGFAIGSGLAGEVRPSLSTGERSNASARRLQRFANDIRRPSLKPARAI
jgi:NADP-dependent 3-hydroxy acid dehydrogenase YdfG